MGEYPKRRWLRFSLRSLLLMITLISLWLGYNLNWIRQRRDALRTDGIQGNPNIEHSVFDKPYSPNGLWILGEVGQSTLVVVARLIPSDRIDELRELFPEAKLWVIQNDGSRITLPSLR